MLPLFAHIAIWLDARVDEDVILPVWLRGDTLFVHIRMATESDNLANNAILY